jgi:heptosyltransferase-1
LTPTKPLKIDSAPIKQILLIRLRRIGDIVMTTPSLTSLRQEFPDAHITYVVEAPYRELVDGHPALDEVFVLPRKPGNREFLAHIRQLRRRHYDILIDFHGGPRAYLLSLFVHARWKIGYRIKYKHFAYDIRVPREPETGYWHSVENHFQLIKTIRPDIRAIPPLSLPPVQDSEKATVRECLSRFQLLAQPFLVLHIGAGNDFRDWGHDKLQQLLDKLLQLPRTAVVLIGAPDDLEKEAKLMANTPQRLFSLVGKLNLREVQELISRAVLFVGPDSGPMHIAATTSTPIVAYFGPTLPANFGPWQAEAVILEKEFDCRPCPQRECRHGDIRCLQSITPDDVFQAVQDRLDPARD